VHMHALFYIIFYMHIFLNELLIVKCTMCIIFTGIASFVDTVRRTLEVYGLRRPRMLKMEEAL